jgi:hypothetical protein
MKTRDATGDTKMKLDTSRVHGATTTAISAVGGMIGIDQAETATQRTMVGSEAEGSAEVTETIMIRLSSSKVAAS